MEKTARWSHVFLGAISFISLSLFLFPEGAILRFPVGIRFFCAVVALGFSPGFLLLNGFSRRLAKAHVSYLTFVLTGVSLSFACNLLVNLILFLAPITFRSLLFGYVGLQWGVFLVGTIVTFRTLNLASLWGEKPNLRKLASREVILSSGVGVLFLALVWHLFAHGSGPVSPEELVILRKLVDNPVIRYTNICMMQGHPTTYLLVPFQVFISGTSLLSRLDVALTYSLFWSVTTVLSIACFVELGRLLFGEGVAFLVAAFAVSVSFFDPESLVVYLGLLIPFPNRYGFSGGVLLPLNLLFLWSLLKERWNWVLGCVLIYLSVEMTFVHARETIIFLVCTAVTAFCLLPARQEQRALFARILSLLAITCTILLGYKVLNLALAKDLNGYVTVLTQDSRATFFGMVKHGFIKNLLSSGPNWLFHQSKEFPIALQTHVVGYQDIFLDSWAFSVDAMGKMGRFSRVVLPIVLVALPWYVWSAASLMELVLAGCFVTFGLLSLSGLLKMGLSALVGNPEVLDFRNLVYIVAILIFCHLLWKGALAFVRSRISTTWRWAIGVPIFGGSLLWTSWMVGLGSVLEHLLRWRIGVFFLFLSGALWLWKLFKVRLPMFSAEKTSFQSPAFFVAGFALILFLVPVLLTSPSLRKDFFAETFPPSRFRGPFLDDYSLLKESGKLRLTYPLEIIKYLRKEIPPNQVILAGNGLSIAMATSHYVSIISENGDVPVSFIDNWPFLLKFGDRSKPFSFASFLDSRSDFQDMRDLLSSVDANWIVTNPSETAAIQAKLPADSLKGLITPVFFDNGFGIYRVLGG